MDLIGRWLASKEYFDIHELEKIRGKLNSWLIVIPMLRLFIREQNAIIQKAYETNNFYQGEHAFDMKNLREEFHVWQNLTVLALSRKWRSDEHTVLNMSEIRDSLPGYQE